MTRFVNPTPKYTDENGDFMPFGLLYFYDTGTNDDKTTYADVGETIANTQPLVLNGDGSTPNCFYSGSAKVKLVMNAGTAASPVNGAQQWERDPVVLNNFTAVAWGVYNFVTDTLTASSGCTVARLSEGMATLTLDNDLTGINNYIPLVNQQRGGIVFTTTKIAFLTAQRSTAGILAGTITSGSTTDLVSHTYGSSLTTNNVQVSAKETLGSASYLYISAVDSSNITIGCDVDPGKDVDFVCFLAVGAIPDDVTDYRFVVYDAGV